jgi:hypothetical protein
MKNDIIFIVLWFVFSATGVLSDLISSLILPGNPIGYLAFRTYTYSCQNQMISFLINLKTAHYMKVNSSC